MDEPSAGHREDERSSEDVFRALQELWTNAGRPSMRSISAGIRSDGSLPDTVSHEVVGQAINGRHIPKWPKLESIVRYLSKKTVPARDADVEAIRAHRLWVLTQRGAELAPEAVGRKASTAQGGVDRILELRPSLERDISDREMAWSQELTRFLREAPISEIADLVRRLVIRGDRDIRRMIMQITQVRTIQELGTLLVFVRPPELPGMTPEEFASLRLYEITLESVAQGLHFGANARQVDCIMELRESGVHDLAFELLRQLANNLDIMPDIDDTLDRAGLWRERELLRAFRTKWDPYPV